MNKENLKKFINKTSLLSGTIMLIVGLTIGLISNKIKIEKIKNEFKIEYEKVDSRRIELEEKSRELQAKVHIAAPFFNMTEVEQETMALEAEKQKEENKKEKERLEKQKKEAEVEERRRLTEGINVFENDKVKINFKKATPSGMEFLVENKTDVEITIQAGSVAVNGLSTDNITMSDHVAPKSKAIVTARCRLNISGDVQIVSGNLRIVDFSDTYDTEEALFTNIEVN